ncbi:MAG TPA: PEP-CTERM sorting domain-containing protein [Phycisphaerae bacterium]|nr:PEP-CTERM sorting domain-containing protein [Phycisphaerae bacterium]
MQAKFLTPVTLAAVTVLGASTLSARAGFEGDFAPTLSGNSIRTDAVSDLDGSTASNVQIFQYDLEGDPTTPGFTEDPGFRPEPGSGLPANSYLGFNVVTSLLYWNGTGTPSFAPVTDASHLELYVGTQSHVFITGNTGPQNGFVIAQLSSLGSAHQHLSSQILGAPMAGGTYLDALGNTYGAPDVGVYAVGIDVVDSTNNTTNPFDFDSGTRWLVYAENVDDDTLTAGADSFAAPAPEPASLSLLGLGGLALLSRRRSA